MLIKGVVSKTTRTARKGDPIPMPPEQALPSALLYGIKNNHNSKEKTFFIEKKATVIKTFRKTVLDKVKNVWSATATGTFKVGHCTHKDGRFHAPLKYSFEVEYKADRDEYGIPDISVVKFVIAPLDATTPKLDAARYEQKKPLPGSASDTIKRKKILEKVNAAKAANAKEDQAPAQE